MINILDKQTADKIAAGEVVDRPASAVKELIENSIDALSGSITVEIEKGGKTYIRVTDNGNGIPADEIEKAFLRHATSKITKIEDLDFIDTLGFRGEALPSIAAVSRVELISKTRDAETGRRVVLEGGKIVDSGPVGCENGTTIIVRDLFYNTPARLKFMKSDNAESRQIIELVSQLAMAYPNIKFRLINNKNVLFSTRGTCKREDSILTIYGKVTGRDLIFFNSGAAFMEMEGYVSDPGVSFPTRKQQIFFVNGRVVESPVISKAVAKAYEERLFKGRFPVAFLFIMIDPAQIDVNVHPNKREIKFHDEEQVAEFIRDSVRNALLSKESIPEIKAKDIFTKKEEPEDAPLKKDEKQEDMRSYLSQIRADETAEKVKETPEFSAPEDSGESIKGGKDTAADEAVPAEPEPSAVPDDTAGEEKPALDISDITIIDTVFDTYILARDSENFYMIDQHAAHERIFFEKFLAEYRNSEKATQQVMIPLMVDIPAAAKNSDVPIAEALGKLGFEAEEFGPVTYRITGVPAFMELDEAERLVRDFIDEAPEAEWYQNEEQFLKVATRACKNAIKGHDRTSPEEREQLLHDLSRCGNPYSCPHGRPTFIKMSQYQIEKMFKRV
ncbi:MAG: DNA mismatch repair endonuclease MutL [Firmicutes bacterium]|nr:DNA mismatch repair endonuclease MutL [Bacillota bacterium]